MGAILRIFRLRAASTTALRAMRSNQARRWISLPSNPSQAFQALTKTACVTSSASSRTPNILRDCESTST